jgi:hypothetical protein
MSDFTTIISDLERQKTALDTAIAALRELNGDVPDWVTGSSTAASPAKKPRKQFSAETRKRMREAQQLRHARARGEV